MHKIFTYQDLQCSIVTRIDKPDSATFATFDFFEVAAGSATSVSDATFLLGAIIIEGIANEPTRADDNKIMYTIIYITLQNTTTTTSYKVIWNKLP